MGHPVISYEGEDCILCVEKVPDPAVVPSNCQLAVPPLVYLGCLLRKIRHEEKVCADHQRRAECAWHLYCQRYGCSVVQRQQS